MNNQMTMPIALVTACLLFAPKEALSYTINACTQPTQFVSGVCDTYTGSEFQTVSSTGTYKAYDSSSQGTPYEISASTATATGGTNSNVARSNASFDGTTILFGDAQPLVDMLAPGSDSLDVFLNFNVLTTMGTNLIPGIFGQSSTSVGVNITASTNGYAGSVNGSARITNGPYDHGFTNSGLLYGLAETGGSVDAMLLVTLFPVIGQELSVDLLASVSSTSSGAQGGSDILLSLFDVSNLLSLADGTSLQSLGVSYSLAPQSAVSAVPLPPSAILFGTALLGLAAIRRRKRKTA